MKVLFFIPGLGNGGAERVFISLNYYFKKLEIKSKILCATRKGDLYKHIDKNQIDFLDANYGLLSFLKLKKYVKKFNPNVIIATLSASIISLALTKIWLGNSDIIYVARIANIIKKPKTIKNKILFYLEGYFINKYDLIICNSNATKRSLKLLKIKKNISIEVIYNPVIEKSFEEVKAVELEKERPIVLSVGRLVKQKRVDHTIRAFARVRKRIGKGHLIIVGNGILLNEIKLEIIKNNIVNHVAIIPFYRNIPELMKSVDCFINTSEFEGFGNIFIESSAYCKNTLSYESEGGASELLRSTNAVLVSDGNESHLSEKLFQILTESKNIGNENEEYIKNFYKDKISKSYLTQISRLYEKDSL